MWKNAGATSDTPTHSNRSQNAVAGSVAASRPAARNTSPM